MKLNEFIAVMGAMLLATTAQSQSSGGGGGGGAAAGGSAGAGAAGGAAGAGAAAGANVNGAAGTAQNPGNQAPANPGSLQQGLPPREQLPPGLQNQNPPALQQQQQQQQAATNALAGQLPNTNFLRFRTNGFGFTNRFGGTNFAGGDTNGFGDTNFPGWRTNHWRTNEFGWRSNRFRGTNDFGNRTNRFRTNQFGLGTNGFTNDLTISNSVEISNQFGVGPGDAGGFIPAGGGAYGVSGGPAAPNAAPASPNATPNETVLAPTGNPGPNRLYGATTNRAGGVALQDRSVTESDRVLLQQVRKLVIPRLETAGGWGPAVHFWIGDSTVTMVGTVPSREAKTEVQDMVAQLPGVKSVKNDLFVGTVDPNASETDQELLYRLRQSVLPQVAPGSTSSPVDFAVRDGVVTVLGRASNSEEAARVQKLVQQVPGVQQVKNEMLFSDSKDGTVLASPALPNDTQPGQTNLQPTGRAPEPGSQPQSQTPPPTPTPDNGAGAAGNPRPQ